MTSNSIGLLISIIIVILAAVFQNLINLRKSNRKYQSVAVIGVIVYCIIAVIAVFGNQDSIAGEIKGIAVSRNTDVIMSNLSAAIGFLILKGIFVVTGKLSLRKNSSPKNIKENRFYSYDPELEGWFLQEKWINVIPVCRALAWMGTGISIIYFALVSGGKLNGDTMYMMPVAIQLIFGEIYNYLNGNISQEERNRIAGDDSTAQNISNFYRIRDIYEKLFAPNVLSANTATDYTSKASVVDRLKDLEKSEDDIDGIVSSYFTLKDDETYDVDGIEATLNLMKGKNTIFSTPFYRKNGKYVTLPVINTLLKGKKVLVVVGRKSVQDDLSAWLKETLESHSRIKSLWRIAQIEERETDCEVGIINFEQLYDIRIFEKNRSFFKNTGFVLLHEPSIILGTGQIGLDIIADELNQSKRPVYCVMDRMVDGLVDTVSHIFNTEFIDVIAAPVPRSMYTGMSWNADGDFLRQKLFKKETRYLGDGIELASVAVKNQIPKVIMIGEKKAPMKDIKWIAGQYFHVISKYMNIPVQQSNLYKKIEFIPNLWFSSDDKEQFIIVEDEFCNMFSMIRTYLSMGERQTFVNVLSENYLLRDYMRCNSQMFMSDCNAIPSIVPDYAKTERNTFIKLMLLMSMRPVRESEIFKQLNLADYDTKNVYDSIVALIKKYTSLNENVLMSEPFEDNSAIRPSEKEMAYRLSGEISESDFSETIKVAYFTIEDEKNRTEPIDAELYGHITQAVLPGQFVTYEGKYYKVKSISPEYGVILRRASDLYDGRKYYRQVRNYRLDNCNNVVDNYNVMDIGVSVINCDISVETTGYLEMESNDNLRTARLIEFKENKYNSYIRNYKNKNVLRIKLPETDVNERFTLCMLLSETFKTVFPELWVYIAVVAARPDDISGMLNYMVYPVEGDYNEEYIYIIEDSDIDLGLIDAIEKNLMRIMEIIADFMDWHFEKMREPMQKDPVIGEVVLPEDEQKRRGLFLRMASVISRLLGGKKAEPVSIGSVESVENKKPEAPLSTDEEEPIEVQTSEEQAEPESVEEGGEKVYTFDEAENDDNDESEAVPKNSDAGEKECTSDNPAPTDAEIAEMDGTDIFDNEEDPYIDQVLEESFEEIGIGKVEKTRYQNECFLKFGFEKLDSRLKLEELKQYFNMRGWNRNSLREARKKEPFMDNELDFDAVNHCDFCGRPLSGVSYEKLNDGRTRCNECSTSAINSEKDFVELFNNILGTMQSFYNIEFKTKINAVMADAGVIAKGVGQIFVPSTDVTARVLGFAQRKHGKYSVFIENGSPRMAAIDTIVHELTHIWQYLNWNDKAICEAYGNGRNRDIVYEGMAMWAAIQYLYLIGEDSYAYQNELIAERREDIYGVGFRLYREKYPLIKDSSVSGKTPFFIFPPL